MDIKPQYPQYGGGGGSMKGGNSVGIPVKVKAHSKHGRVNGARKATSTLLPKASGVKR